MSTETTNITKSSNIVSIEKVKNACFGANPDLHGFCTDSAQGEFAENDHCAVIDRALNKATRIAADEEKNRKLYEKLVAVKLTSFDTGISIYNSCRSGGLQGVIIVYIPITFQ